MTSADDKYRAQLIAAVDAKIRGDIGKHGLHVFGSVTAEGLPYLHSIGLQGHDLPELVVVGLSAQYGYPIVNEIGKWCIRNDTDLIMPGREWSVPDFGPEVTWKAGSVSAAWAREYMSKVRRFFPVQWRPGMPGSVVQVLWPDDDGRHPGPLWAPPHQPLLADWASPPAITGKPG